MEAEKLTGVVELIKESFRIYFKKENFIYFIKIALINILVALILLTPTILFSLSLRKDTPFEQGFGILGFIFLLSIPFYIAALWLYASTIKAVSVVVGGNVLGIKETLSAGWKRLGNFFIAGVLVILAVLGGSLLFIIPGIIFGVWFFFAQFVAVTEGLGGRASLSRSKELVSGYFWPISGRLFVLGLVAFIIQLVVDFIPFVGPVIAILLTPYYLLLPYLLYEDLKRVKG